ncbi:putative ribosomal protein L2 domain 2 [Medicago truncatula]|uniref:Putative ribosomal protein L2 domain 2 n=1 Tax=Medicago truncatula TaxID=3880 RepID=A0A396JTY8_MEDTR|nr:putative ribosomal protein L2 domain 2 [Medicago truncatula]
MGRAYFHLLNHGVSSSRRKEREGKVVQVYGRKWVIHIESITREDLFVLLLIIQTVD